MHRKQNLWTNLKTSNFKTLKTRKTFLNSAILLTAGLAVLLLFRIRLNFHWSKKTCTCLFLCGAYLSAICTFGNTSFILCILFTIFSLNFYNFKHKIYVVQKADCSLRENFQQQFADCARKKIGRFSVSTAVSIFCLHIA